MTRLHIYADESGNFDFSRGPKATQYFVLTTVFLGDHGIANDLLSLRRDLAWDGVDLHQEFHATEDKQCVRDRVFEVITSHDFRIDATILNKRKAQPQVRVRDTRFYKYGWFYHMRYLAPRVASSGDEVLIIAASLGTRSKRASFYDAIKDVMEQVSPTPNFRAAFWPAAVDPCLQVADYCCWAVQRKWESGDERSYTLIKNKIRSEFDLFRGGGTEYY